MCPEDVLEELTRTSHRHYSTGFISAEKVRRKIQSTAATFEWEVVGVVDEWREGTAFLPNAESSCLERRWKRLRHPARLLPFTPEWIQMKAEKQSARYAHAMMRFSIPCTAALPEGIILRRRANAAEG